MLMTNDTNPQQENPSIDRSSTSTSLEDSSWLSRLLREPLLHFLCLGTALFVLYGYLNNDEDTLAASKQIVVTEGKIEHLATLFARTWQRPPTQEELEGLVEDYVREEAAYREGTALGLDSNDTIIRRRIRQKLDFVADDLASQLEPTDEDLGDYFQKHSDDFRVDSKFTFQHVYFDPGKHSGDLDQVVYDLVAKLRENQSVNTRELGDRTLLEYRYESVSEREIASLFGVQFATALTDVVTGMWQGPVESSYGAHAVFVENLSPGSLPELDSVRDSVRREWEHARRQELTERYYQGLLNKYDVVIQWPDTETE